MNTEDIDADGDKRLLPFEQAALDFLEIKQGHAMIVNNADKMGTGESIQVLVSYLQRHTDARPTIICCPAILKNNWKKQLEQSGIKNNIEVLEGRKTKTITSSIIIIDYYVLGKWEEELLKFSPKIIVLDGSDKLKNYPAATKETIKKVAEKTEKVILLADTPLNKGY